jgi:hypothetical protein
MKRKDPVEDRVDWLAVVQSVLNKPDIASGGG